MMHNSLEELFPIAAPPWNAEGKKIESLIRKACFDFQLLDGAGDITVALSGGKDSLALLFMLHAINGRGFEKFNLSAAHVSGEFSCGASMHESYLKNICNRLEIPLIIKQSEQKLDKLECYSCSRERRKLLFDAAKSFGSKKVAFGHHQDDHIQTLLLNLLHKGEFEGNLPYVPMHHYGITILRPLIYVSEKDIIKFATHYGFARITCQCPVGQDSKRKKAELHLKEIEKDFVNARTNLAQAGLKFGSKKALAVELTSRTIGSMITTNETHN